MPSELGQPFVSGVPTSAFLKKSCTARCSKHWDPLWVFQTLGPTSKLWDPVHDSWVMVKKHPEGTACDASGSNIAWLGEIVGTRSHGGFLTCPGDASGSPLFAGLHFLPGSGRARPGMGGVFEAKTARRRWKGNAVKAGGVIYLMHQMRYYNVLYTMKNDE